MPSIKLLAAPTARFYSILYIIFFLQSGAVFSQEHPIGAFGDHQDIGNPKLSGSAVYNEKDQTYLLSGAGKNIWTNLDQFQYVFKKIKGDFIIQTTVQDSRYADGSVHGGLPLLTSLQFRASDGDTT